MVEIASNTESWGICRSIRTYDAFVPFRVTKHDPNENSHPVESAYWTFVCIGDARDVRNVAKVNPVVCTICGNLPIDLWVIIYKIG